MRSAAGLDYLFGQGTFPLESEDLLGCATYAGKPEATSRQRTLHARPGNHGRGGSKKALLFRGSHSVAEKDQCQELNSA